ncbi:hypothetical protein B0H19DRAFT_1250102 [Mycena capillaripes]|nr:hypothetical protein B0H19DRAFT_1250102 [Mycena capillaripes]
MIPLLPQEIIDEILSHLRGDSLALKACTLANSSFYPTSQKLMFSRLKMGPRPKDLTPEELHRLLYKFPEMARHVDEIIMRCDPHKVPEYPPSLPLLPALRRICISNVLSDDDDHPCLFTLLSSPSLVHFQVNSMLDAPLPAMLAALPRTLKTLVLEKVGYMQPYWFDSGLDLHAVAGPIHLESLTIESFGYGPDGDQSEVQSVLLDLRSRVVLCSIRHLAFVSRDHMIPGACAILQECAQSLHHLEFRFWPSEVSGDVGYNCIPTTPHFTGFAYSTDPFFDETIESTFPQLRSVAFVFASNHTAPISRISDILAVASESSLQEIVLRLNIRVGTSSSWCDNGFPVVDVGLLQIPTLVRVTVLIRIMNRGRHSIAAHTTFIQSSMPLTGARGILRIKQVFCESSVLSLTTADNTAKHEFTPRCSRNVAVDVDMGEEQDKIQKS